MPNDSIGVNDEEDEALGDQNGKEFPVGPDASFMTACINGDVQNVLDSLSLGADINKPGLEEAIRNNHIEVVSLLLDCPELEINIRQKFGFTPLMLAASLGNLEILQLLLAQPVIEVNAVEDDQNLSALMIACSLGHTEVAKELLKKSDVNQVGKGCVTALVLASINGDLAIVKMLLEKGVNINTNLESGVTVFKFSLWNHVEIAQLLLRQADLEIKDDIFVPPLQIASSKGQVDIVKELIRFGCNVDIRLKSYTLISITMLDCDHPDKVLKIVDMLLQAGCKPKKEDVTLALNVPRLQGILRQEYTVPSTLLKLCRKVIWSQLRICSNGKNIQPLVSQLKNTIPDILVDYLRFVSTF